jgi:hypothetical protein
MRCLRCGILKRGSDEDYVCPDCEKFGPIIRTIYEDVDKHLTSKDVIDPETDQVLRFLADASFITAQNPHSSIYYRLSSVIVEHALKGELEVSETMLNREIRTVRSWVDAFKVFEELGLVHTRVEELQRVLEITEKSQKLAQQFLGDASLTDQLRKRLAHVYAGYVMLSLLDRVATINKSKDESILPYNQRPRTLWTVLMFLWSSAYDKHDTFGEEELRVFISRRGIPSSTRGRLVSALQMNDGRVVQGMVKHVKFVKGERRFTFDDYVIDEMKRFRELVRVRSR